MPSFSKYQNVETTSFPKNILEKRRIVAEIYQESKNSNFKPQKQQVGTHQIDSFIPIYTIILEYIVANINSSVCCFIHLLWTHLSSLCVLCFFSQIYVDYCRLRIRLMSLGAYFCCGSHLSVQQQTHTVQQIVLQEILRLL